MGSPVFLCSLPGLPGAAWIFSAAAAACWFFSMFAADAWFSSIFMQLFPVLFDFRQPYGNVSISVC
jgi:hypothetical protein